MDASQIAHEQLHEQLFFRRTFPHLEHIDQVLPAIEGRQEFIVRDRGWYKSVDYTFALPRSFPDYGEPNWDILRECRGLIFESETGRLLSRPYHKVRNYLESAESRNLREIHFSDACWLEKLDGSMIRPLFRPDGQLCWATRAGFTDVGQQVGRWAQVSPRAAAYSDFCREMIRKCRTPIFEWCSRLNRIVIDHPEPRLVLTAIRDNYTGEYASLDEMKHLADVYEVDVVDTLPGLDIEADLSTRLRFIADLHNQEGVVVRWPSGEMLKIKAEDYVRLRTKSLYGRERDLLELIKTGKLDDLKPLLGPAELERVEAYENAVVSGMVARLSEFVSLCAGGTGYEIGRDLAVNYVAKIPEKRWSSLLFAAAKLNWQIESHMEFLWQFVLTNSQRKVDETRWIHGATWAFEMEGGVDG